MANDEWEDEFLSTRHVHNRGSRKTNRGGTKGQRTFDVRRTFGSYEVKCPAAERIRSTGDNAATKKEERKPEEKLKSRKKAKKDSVRAEMEIKRLTDDGNGLLGELVLPGLLEAGLVLAATKKGLENFEAETQANGNEISDMEQPFKTVSKIETSDEGSFQCESGSESEEEYEDPETSTLSEDTERERFEKFEKNSFRQPKFWLWWRGRVRDTVLVDDDDSWTLQSGVGYVVFAGNSCKRFEGTLSCERYDWEDVTFYGYKF